MNLLRILTVLVAILAAGPAHAQDFTWQGNLDNNWDTTVGGVVSNWFRLGPPGGIPGSGDTVTFSENPANSYIVDVDSSRTISAATFSGNEDYTLIGGSALTLSLADGDITTLGSATHEIKTNVGLGSAGVWDIANPLFEVSGNITGSFGLTKTGIGTLLLTGSNSYTGLTTIDGGTVQVGDGGTSGSIAGNVANNGSLIFNRSDDLTYGGVISGSGDLTKIGAGDLTLSAANTYSGGTTVDDGTLMLGNDNALGSGGLTINAGALVDLDANTRRVHGDIAVNDGTFNLAGTTLNASGSVQGNAKTPGHNIMLSGSGGLLDATGSALINLNGLPVTDGIDPATDAGSLVVSGGIFNLGASANLTARGGVGFFSLPGTVGSVSLSGGTSTIDGTINLSGQTGTLNSHNGRKASGG